MRAVVLMLLLLWPLGAQAEPGQHCSDPRLGQVMCIRPAHFGYDVCQAIAAFADREDLPRGFFARLIWQESRFDPNALSPADARGIAQFIPATAARRGLSDPYNPADALAYAARYLAEMRQRFGNLGLAAVGYNGGEGRAAGLLRGDEIPAETSAYVRIITGLPAQAWREGQPQAPDMALSDEMAFFPACYALAAQGRISPLRPPPDAQGLPPWGVRVAFGKSEDAARRAATQKTRACRNLVTDERPDLLYKPNRVARKSGYYFAQFGRDTRGAAEELCRGMRRLGCLCRVVRQ